MWMAWYVCNVTYHSILHNLLRHTHTMYVFLFIIIIIIIIIYMNNDGAHDE